MAVEALEDRLVPATFVVDTLADGIDGDVSAGNFSLREAIEQANNSGGTDTITFDAGLAGQTILLTDGELKLTDSVTIDGDLDNNGAPDITVQRDADANDFRLFYVNDGDSTINQNVVIDGLAITGGRLTGSSNEGGGIYNNENLTVSHSTIRGNSNTGSFSRGGGIFNSHGTVTVTNSNLSENSAQLTGGGISNDGGTVTVTNSTLAGNSAQYGGGVLSGFGTATVTSSTLSGNSAERGGGIFNSYGTMTVANSTLSGNSAQFGGGIYNFFESTVMVTSATLSGNSAQHGGAIFTANYNNVNTTLHSTIVAGNTHSDNGTANDIGGRVLQADSTHNLIGDGATAGGLIHGVNGNIVGDGSGGTLDINTVLNTELADNGGPTRTHALVAGSAAIDAGSNLDDLTTDQRGYKRALDLLFADNAGDGTDIGAIEYGVRELQSTYGFATTGNLWKNWGGLQEKWFQDEGAGAWYFITPEGFIYQWDGGSDLSTSTPVAQVSSANHHDLSLLFDPDASASQYTSSELQASYGFVAGDDLWENWGGWEEKWFVDQTGVSHFITPSGRIYRWDGGTNLSDSILVAQVDAGFFADLTQLFNA